MNVMNGTYNIKNNMLQNVTPAAVRISGAAAYSYGTSLTFHRNRQDR